MLYVSKKTIYKDSFTWELIKFYRIEDFRDFSEVKNDLVQLYIKAYKDLDDYHYKTLDDIEKYIYWLYSHNLESSVVIIAKIGRDIVGFIAGDAFYYDKDVSYVMNIHELVVDPLYRGRGIATSLIYEFIQQSKSINEEEDRKINKVILWVGKDNTRAIKLYQNLGFSYLSKSGKWIKMIMNIWTKNKGTL